ncbi:MAG TPA: transporter [Nitrospirota bacterium]|nr:transporter [Nitrospirota bacterium]
MLKTSLVAIVTIACALAGEAFAAHPLITDDSGTQGKGNVQLEFIGEYGIDKHDGVREKSLQVPTVPFLTYGLTDATDIVMGLPYNEVVTEDAAGKSAVRGIGDASLELKTRFYEKDGLSFAVKPGITLPTGDENKGLGNGRVSYHAFLITTKEVQPCAFHLNLGYIHNQYKFQADEDANRKDLWHVSLAAQAELVKNVKAVANIGMERNPDKTSEAHPAFILGGLICSITENLDIDAGIKYGLNRPETDIAYLAGITWRL